MNRESCPQVNRWVINICDLNEMRCVIHGQVSVWPRVSIVLLLNRAGVLNLL